MMQSKKANNVLVFYDPTHQCWPTNIDLPFNLGDLTE